MKKYLITVIIALSITGLAFAQVGPGRTMYVNVRSADLKSGTGVFASASGTLNYGEQVTVIRTDGKFAEVRSDANSSLSGWTALTNLSTRKVVATASTSASVSEVALAGKGFSQENENTYKSQGELNYTAVDVIEKLMANAAELRRFIEAGGLSIPD
jgi:uncharacterized protein YgiM (DUF1202 family)